MQQSKQWESGELERQRNPWIGLLDFSLNSFLILQNASPPKTKGQLGLNELRASCWRNRLWLRRCAGGLKLFFQSWSALELGLWWQFVWKKGRTVTAPSHSVSSTTHRSAPSHYTQISGFCLYNEEFSCFTKCKFLWFDKDLEQINTKDEASEVP